MTDNRAITTPEQNDELNFWRNMLQINTCIPAIVDTFDSATQRISARPAIRGKFINPDDFSVQYFDYPKITNIPLSIQWSPNIGGITYPIKSGDICTLIFSQRSLDNFLISGKTSNPFDPADSKYTEIRLFDLTDAMCFPGIITNNLQIQGYNNDAIEVRTVDGLKKVSVSENELTMQAGTSIIKVTEAGIDMTALQININGNVNIISPAATTITAPATTITAATTLSLSGGGSSSIIATSEAIDLNSSTVRANGKVIV